MRFTPRLIFALLLITFALFTTSLCTKASELYGSCGQTSSWSIDTASGILTISGDGDITSPITGIPELRDSVKHIIFDAEITSISDCAFGFCTVLESVTFKNGSELKSIGDFAFQGCTQLKSITFPDTMESIGNFAFYDCDSITQIHFPESVSDIGYSAFMYCSGITDISIGANVEKIGASAFAGCKKLVGITVDENNTEYSSDSRGALYDKQKTKLLQYPAGNKASFCIIPYSVTEISDYALQYSDISTIYYPGTTTQWQDIRFGYNNAPRYSAAVKYNYIPPENTGTCGDGITWKLNEGVLTISGNGSITAWSTAASVPWNMHKPDIRRVIITDGVLNIPELAFKDCRALESICIPASVRDISLSAINSSRTVTLYGAYSTYAQSYAKEKNLPFVFKGDVNIDGAVNSQDLIRLVKHVNGTDTVPDVQAADINSDARITAEDIAGFSSCIPASAD